MTTSAPPEPEDAAHFAAPDSPLASARATLQEQREHLEQLTARRPDLEPALLEIAERTNLALRRLDDIETRLAREGTGAT